MRVLRGLAFVALTGAWLGSACGPGDGSPDLGPGAGQGALEVRWFLEKQDGVPTECDQVDVAQAQVDLAGLAETVECGEDQVVRFEMLTPGRYPVRIRLLDSADDLVDEHTETVTIEADTNARVGTTFQLSGTGPSTGDLILTWTIDDLPASQECARVGGDRVEITAELGSIDPDVGGTVACAAGRVEFEDVRIGGYAMRIRLRDATGASLALDQESVQVRPGEETTVPMNLSVTTSQPASLFSRWTIGGVEADPGCMDAGAEKVQARVQRLSPDLQYVTIATSSSACDRGQLRTENLQTSMGVFRVIYDLIDDSLMEDVVISSTTANQVRLRPAQTTTIALDFPAVQ